jgi:hypothetical protein
VICDRVGQDIRVRCLAAETGRELWQQRYPTDYVDTFGYDGGPRASAVIAGVDYLVTQNCTHIANAATIPAIYSMLDSLGFGPVLICTPAEFFGEINNGTQ